MYQIKCDENIIYDPRIEGAIVSNPKCKLEVNTVGEASFSIYATHKHYDKMQKMKSTFEILQDGKPIFRGRMTNDSKDFNNTKMVDLEGLMACFNDSLIRPFSFPDDFLNNVGYKEAAKSGNVVEFFLGWLIGEHNWRMRVGTGSFYTKNNQFKLGVVTVTDPNNYITRSSEDYLSAWEILKTKLFESSLGGYLCIRYEEDGNYIDYLADFDETNTQKIKFGENLLDILSESDASMAYNAVLPLGARMNEIDENSKSSRRLTTNEFGFDDDKYPNIYAYAEYMVLKDAADEYGVIFAPVSETTWEDVKNIDTLRQRGIDYLLNNGAKFASTITIKAVDLHFSDDEIEAFRIYKYVDVKSVPHNHEEQYKLTKLEIDLQNPQNTVITLGETQMTMTDINASTKQTSKDFAERIEIALSNADLKAVTESISLLATELQETEKDLQEQIDDIVDSLENEWIALTLADSFAAYGGLEANKPMYKLSGNTVEVKGCVVPLTEYTSSTEKVVFASGIPEEFCPSSVRSFICQGEGMNRWMLTVETDGTLTISRYGVSECVAVPTTEGLVFNGTYTIEQKGTDES